MENLEKIVVNILIGWCGPWPVSIPIGIVVALIVRRIMPLVNLVAATLVAGYVVGVAVLFVILRRLFPESALGISGMFTISSVVAAGLVVVISYVLKRSLYAHEARLKQEQSFAVFGEDARDKPKNLRRR